MPARTRASSALGRASAPYNHHTGNPANPTANALAVNGTTTHTAVHARDTSENDVVYEAADEGAVALDDAQNVVSESNGALQSHNVIENLESASYATGSSAEVRNSLYPGIDDEESGVDDGPEADVLASVESRQTKKEAPRSRKTKQNKTRKATSPKKRKDGGKNKGKGKEKDTDSGPSDETETPGLATTSSVEEAVVSPLELSRTRPRTRAVVKAEQAAAAGAASRQTKGKGRAVEQTPLLPSNAVKKHTGRGQKNKKATSDNVANSAGPSRTRGRGAQPAVEPSNPTLSLVVPDRARKLRRGKLVSAETPAPRTRTRRQQRTATTPTVEEEKVEEENAERQNRDNKRTRQDFEDDDSPDDAPPRVRTKLTHNPAKGPVATSSNVTAEQLPEPSADENADAELEDAASPVAPVVPEEDEVASIVPVVEAEAAEPEVDVAEPVVPAPEIPEVEVQAPEVPAVPEVAAPAPAEVEAAAPPVVVAPQLPAHFAVFPPELHGLIHNILNQQQQQPQGQGPAQGAANNHHRPLRRSETTLFNGRIYRR